VASDLTKLALLEAQAQETGHGTEAATTVTAEHGNQAAGHGADAGSHAFDPMHQFEIKRLIPFEIFGIDASFTNSALWMLIGLAVICLFTIFSMGGRAIVPGRFQSIAELGYEFVAKMLRDNVGDAGQKYFPFVFTLGQIKRSSSGMFSLLVPVIARKRSFRSNMC